MLDKVIETQPISNFRKAGPEILEAVDQGPVVVTQHGVAAAVLMSVEHYNNIVSYVRAFHDAELLRRRLSDMDRDEGEFLTFEEFGRRMRERGLVYAA